ncbi:RNA polymerase sigma factor [Membranihabitans marinus]|uniref:RNA polymerase sigma factor n=1 Tax=Membranihabitans marinus TaxID=1227546 RepID=UPI0021D44F79|nr:sigma-70 family RNA polymerase sigma factor [Membranihabitans marinus]
MTINLSKHSDFEKFYKLHFVNMVKYCLVRTESQSVAEEIVQESFVKLWENRQKSIQQPQSYLFMIVRNNLANYYRNHQLQQTTSIEQAYSLTEKNSDQENNLPDPSLKIAIEELPEKCKHIVVMSYYEGLTKSEIAQYLGISSETVKKQRTIGLRKLREKLRLMKKK